MKAFVTVVILLMVLAIVVSVAIWGLYLYEAGPDWLTQKNQETGQGLVLTMLSVFVSVSTIAMGFYVINEIHDSSGH